MANLLDILKNYRRPEDIDLLPPGVRRGENQLQANALLAAARGDDQFMGAAPMPKKVGGGALLPFAIMDDGSRELDFGEGITGAAYDAFTAPKRAYDGEFDPMSDDGIGEAFNMVGMLMGGVAVPRPTNSLGMFGRPERLRQSLGDGKIAVHKSPIGELGEFSSAGARLKADGDFEGRLADAIDAPDVFSAYPELADVRTTLSMSKGGDGRPSGQAFVTEPKSIMVSGAETGDILSTLLHETQHQIAGVDDLPFGAGLDETFANSVRGLGFASDAPKLSPADLYRRSAGEMLANGAEHNNYWSNLQPGGRVPRGDWNVEEMRDTAPDFGGLTLWDLTVPELRKRAAANK